MACKISQGIDSLNILRAISKPLIGRAIGQSLLSTIHEPIIQSLKEKYPSDFAQMDYSELKDILLSTLGKLNEMVPVKYTPEEIIAVATHLSDIKNLYGTVAVSNGISPEFLLGNTPDQTHSGMFPSYTFDENGNVSEEKIKSEEHKLWKGNSFYSTFVKSFKGAENFIEDVVKEFSTKVYESAVFSKYTSTIFTSAKFNDAVKEIKAELKNRIDTNKELVETLNTIKPEAIGAFLLSPEGAAYLQTYKDMQTYLHFPIIMKRMFGASVDMHHNETTGEITYYMKDGKSKIYKQGWQDGDTDSMLSLNGVTQLHIENTHLLRWNDRKRQYEEDPTMTLNKGAINRVITGGKFQMVTPDPVSIGNALRLSKGNDPYLNAIYFKFFENDMNPDGTAAAITIFNPVENREFKQKSLYQIVLEGTTVDADGAYTQTDDAKLADKYLTDFTSQMMSVINKGYVSVDDRGMSTEGFGQDGAKQVTMEDLKHSWDNLLTEKRTINPASLITKENENPVIAFVSGKISLQFEKIGRGFSSYFKLKGGTLGGAEMDQMLKVLGLRGQTDHTSKGLAKSYMEKYSRDEMINLLGSFSYVMAGANISDNLSFENFYAEIGVKPSQMETAIERNKNSGLKIYPQDIAATGTYFDRVQAVINEMNGVDKKAVIRNSDGNIVPPYTQNSPGELVPENINRIKELPKQSSELVQRALADISQHYGKDTLSAELAKYEYLKDNTSVLEHNSLVTGTYVMEDLDEKNTYYGKSHLDLNIQETMNMNIDEGFIKLAAKSDFKNVRIEPMVPSDKNKYYWPMLSRKGSGEFMPVIEGTGKLDEDSLFNEYYEGPAKEYRERAKAMVVKWRAEAIQNGVPFPADVQTLSQIHEYVESNKDLFSGIRGWGLTLDYDYDKNTGNVNRTFLEKAEILSDPVKAKEYMVANLMQSLGNLTSFSGELSKFKKDNRTGANIGYKMTSEAARIVAERFPEKGSDGESLWADGSVYKEGKVNPAIEAYFWHKATFGSSWASLNQGVDAQYGNKGAKGDDLASRESAGFVTAGKRNVSTTSTLSRPNLAADGERTRRLGKHSNVAFFDDVKLHANMLATGQNKSQEVLDGAIFYHELERLKLMHSFGDDVSALTDGRILKDIQTIKNLYDGSVALVKDAGHLITSELIDNSRGNIGEGEINMYNVNRNMLGSIPFDRPMTLKYNSIALDVYGDPAFSLKQDVQYNTLWEVYKDLGGTSNPKIWEDLIEVMFKYPETDGKYIGKALINTSVKMGAHSSNGPLDAASVDGVTWKHVKINNYNLGIQLNAHHDPTQFDSNLSKIGQINTALAFEGMAIKETSAVFDVLGILSDYVTSREVEKAGGDIEFAKKAIMDKVTSEGEFNSIYAKITAEEQFNLNDRQLSKMVHSTVQSAFEKVGINLKFPGMQFVVHPAASLYKVYDVREEVEGKTVVKSMMRRELISYLKNKIGVDFSEDSPEAEAAKLAELGIIGRRLRWGDAVNSEGESIQKSPQFIRMALMYKNLTEAKDKKNGRTPEQVAEASKNYQSARIWYNKLLSSGEYTATDAEVLLPNSFIDKYGIDAGQSINEIREDKEFFWKRWLQNPDNAIAQENMVTKAYEKYSDRIDRLRGKEQVKLDNNANILQYDENKNLIRNLKLNVEELVPKLSFNDFMRTEYKIENTGVYKRAIQQHTDFFDSITGFAARIPATGKQSANNFTVVGFINDSGNAIGIPVESMLVKGEDLDIDKANVQMLSSDNRGLIFPFFTHLGRNVTGLVPLNRKQIEEQFSNAEEGTPEYDMYQEYLRLEKMYGESQWDWYEQGLMNSVTRNIMAAYRDMDNFLEKEDPVTTEDLGTFRDKASVEMDFSQEDFTSVPVLGMINKIGKVQIATEASAQKAYGGIYYTAMARKRKGLYAGIEVIAPKIVNGRISTEATVTSTSKIVNGRIATEETVTYTSVANIHDIHELVEKAKVAIKGGDTSIIQNAISLLDDARTKKLITESAYNRYSQLINAATDNAKELILGAINSNPITSGYINTMLAAGMPLNDLFTLMTSPEIRQLTKIAEENNIRSITNIPIEKVPYHLKQLNEVIGMASKSVNEFSIIGKISGITQNYKNDEFSLYKLNKDISKHLRGSQIPYMIENKWEPEFLEFDFFKILQMSDEEISKLSEAYRNRPGAVQSFNVLEVLYEMPHYLRHHKVQARSKKVIDQLLFTPKLNANTANNFPISVNADIYQRVEKSTQEFIVKNYFLTHSEVKFKGELRDISTLAEQLKFVTEFSTRIDDYKEMFPDNKFIQTLQNDTVQNKLTGKRYPIVRSLDIKKINDLRVTVLGTAFESLPQEIQEELFTYSLLVNNATPSSMSYQGITPPGVQRKYSRFLDMFGRELSTNKSNTKYHRDVVEHIMNSDPFFYETVNFDGFLHPQSQYTVPKKAKDGETPIEQKPLPPRVRVYDKISGVGYRYFVLSEETDEFSVNTGNVVYTEIYSAPAGAMGTPFNINRGGILESSVLVNGLTLENAKESLSYNYPERIKPLPVTDVPITPVIGTTTHTLNADTTILQIGQLIQEGIIETIECV